MASHPFRALWAAFRACWIASDPSPTNQADERLVALPKNHLRINGGEPIPFKSFHVEGGLLPKIESPYGNDVHSRKADPVLWHEIAGGSRRVVRASIPFGAGFVDFYGHDEAELAEMVAGFAGTDWDNDITAEGV